ncbi:MAG: hypothetical protein A2Y87_01940 [Bacteroidetes bacterium RBG_13_46_8]|nr:MAG: hypothetical protein A2Y87_01940 [Bacteroidetes bacterium RBG_13_46_8]
MAKRKIIWSPEANLDLQKIVEYFFRRNLSKTYSRKLYLQIRKYVRLLSRHPFLGLQTDEENVRILIHGDYAIFYRVNDDTIHILSIWDCRQDPESLTLTKY